jgi:hypothetical protein
MGVDFGSYKSDEVLITRFFKGRSPNGQKIHEEMFNIRDSKGKGNKNHMKIAPHSC